MYIFNPKQYIYSVANGLHTIKYSPYKKIDVDTRVLLEIVKFDCTIRTSFFTVQCTLFL